MKEFQKNIFLKLPSVPNIFVQDCSIGYLHNFLPNFLPRAYSVRARKYEAQLFCDSLS